MNVYEFAELAASHALDALSPEDERLFLATLAEHPEWTGIVASDAETAGALADGVAEIEPPAEVWAGIAARLGGRRADRAVRAASTPEPESEPEPEPRIADSPRGGLDAAPTPPGPSVALAAPVTAPDWLTAAPARAIRGDPDDPFDPDDPREIVAGPSDPASPEALGAGEGVAGPQPSEQAETDPLPYTVPAHLAPLAELAPELVPALARRPDAPSTEMIQTVERRNWTRTIVVVVASLAVLVGLGFVAGRIGGIIHDRPIAIAARDEIHAAPDASHGSSSVTGGGEITADWSSQLHKAVLFATGIAALGGDETYQAWFTSGGDSVAAGTFVPDADGTASVVLGGAPRVGESITITVEPAEGTTEPTSEPVATIAAS